MYFQQVGESAGWVCKASSGCGILAWLVHYLGVYQEPIIAVAALVSAGVALASFISDWIRRRRRK